MRIVLTSKGLELLKELGLSKAEIKVCEKALIHDTQQSMANSLFVSVKTIKYHLMHIYKKIEDADCIHGLLLYLIPFCAIEMSDYKSRKIIMPILKEEIMLPEGNKW